MANQKILLIGDIVIDVTLKNKQESIKVRLGGIVHAARGLWALDIPYSVAYFSPTYLDDQIADYLKAHGCENIIKLGDVTKAPYVFLVQDAKEIGDQGYDFLLRNDIKIDYFDENIGQISEGYSDYILISGNYNPKEIIPKLNGNIHIDVANNVDNLDYFKAVDKQLSTLFISTSSIIFQKYYSGHFETFANLFKEFTDKLILKENRGGSRGVDFKLKQFFSASAQTSPIKHSIGVGDVFDACFVTVQGNENALVVSSWVAAEYAYTTHPDDFKNGVSRISKVNIDDLISLTGVSLPWEDRPKINIYLAAPDFENIDTSAIDLVESSLRYHNFSPRRPIKENGLMEANASKQRKQELFNKDMTLLDECSILIAILLYNDPGTLIEIGVASAKGMPTIVYDPYNQAENCILTELPNLISNDLDKIISEVFVESAKIK